MRINVKKTTILNHDGYGPTTWWTLAEEEVGHGPEQEYGGESILSLWLPDGSEVYETQSGETAVKVPDSAFMNGFAFYSLSDAVEVFKTYLQNVND